MTMGQKAIDIAYELIDGNDVDDKVITPVVMITKDNISDYDISGWQ